MPFFKVSVNDAALHGVAVGTPAQHAAARFAASLSPACCRTTVACAERAPDRQTATTGVPGKLCGASGQFTERDQIAPRICPSGPLYSDDSRNVEDLNLVGGFFQRLGLDFPDAREGVGQRRPGRRRERHVSVLPPPNLRLAGTATSIVRMRQVQIVHVAGEVGFADLTSQARIEAPLFRHARHRETAIVMCGVEQTNLGSVRIGCAPNGRVRAGHLAGNPCARCPGSANSPGEAMLSSSST